MADASPSAGTDALIKLLKQTPVANILREDASVLTVKSTDDAVEAFKQLVERGVQSAPVWDEKKKQYVGSLDVRDLTKHVVQLLEPKVEQKEQPSQDMLTRGSTYVLKGVFDIIAASKNRSGWKEMDVGSSLTQPHNRFFHVQSTATLFEVCQLLKSVDCHRVAVLAQGDASKIQDIVSQSSVIAFLSHQLLNNPALKGCLEITIKDAKIGTSPVLSVTEASSAIQTFRKMADANRQGIAVVDAKTGTLLCNTSASDLRLFLLHPGQNMPLLHMPVVDYLAKSRRSNASELREFPTIAVRAHDSVARAIGKLAATKIHRIFVAEDARGFKPERVISLTDILSFIVK